MEPLNASDSKESVRYTEIKAISFVLPMADNGDLKRSFEIIQKQNIGLTVKKWCVAKHGEERVQNVAFRNIENVEIVVYVPAEDVEQLMRNAYKIKCFGHCQSTFSPQLCHRNFGLEAVELEAFEQQPLRRVVYLARFS